MAVAATNGVPAGGNCNRHDAAEHRELDARGRAVRCSQGRDEHVPGGGNAKLCARLPRAVGGGEGTSAQLRMGRRALLVAARKIAMYQLRGGACPNRTASLLRETSRMR